MKEEIQKSVSNLNSAAVESACKEFGIELSDLLEGTDETVESISDRNGHMSWATWCHLFNAAVERTGEIGIKRIAYYGVFAKDYGKLHNILTGMISPYFMYFAQSKFMGKMLFKNSTYNYKRVKHRITLEVSFNEEEPVPPSFWRSYQECYCVFPTFVGAKRASVSRIENGNSCKFEIDVHPKISILKKVTSYLLYLKGAKKNLEFLSETQDAKIKMEEMAKETRQLNEKLKQLNTVYDKSRKINNIMLGSLGHDIVNQVQIGMMSLSVMEKEMKLGHLDRLPGLMNKIEKSYSVITDMSSVSRSLSNQLTLDKLSNDKSDVLNPVELVVECVNQMSHICAGKNSIELINHIEQEISIEVDKTIFSQSILNNIIKNAIKYSYKDSIITVDLNLDSTNFIIRVIDNGVGMTEGQLDYLFTFNSRSTTLGTDGEKGTGLGMSITKELVDYFGGDISAVSSTGEDDHGTIITMSFPLIVDNETEHFLPENMNEFLASRPNQPDYTTIDLN